MVDGRNPGSLATGLVRVTDMTEITAAARRQRPRLGAWVLLATVVLLSTAWFLSQNETVPGTSIAGYRVVDDRTIVVTVVVPPQSWTRVAQVVETPLAVRVTVDTLPWPELGPGKAADFQNVSIRLGADLGERTVADGSGVAIEERGTDH